MKTERIESGLQPRTWSFNRPGQTPARQLVLFTEGNGEVETKDGRFVLNAPAIVWLGDVGPSRLRIAAGAAGYRAWTDERTITEALGDHAESASLAALADRDFALSLAGYEEVASLQRCLAAIGVEQAVNRPGSSTIISALLRIVLALLLRVSGGGEAAIPSAGERASLLQRFRQLVEMNFRSHWTIAQYAQALSISTDRLHAISKAGVGKTPKELVSERLAHEAATRLERSSLTIEQLGNVLGFGDPAHFSNFFRKMRGMPPGRYRRLAASTEEGRQMPARFADWP
ncbi:MAG: AraC family transcriptional regulator [Mesorhizobium sp.]|nr:AraC family transcriptional regulator [Mesorhizobium sp.]MCO5162059.1 AraC family transcriptional regulator [Mesorhizobium sp.]